MTDLNVHDYIVFNKSRVKIDEVNESILWNSNVLNNRIKIYIKKKRKKQGKNLIYDNWKINRKKISATTDNSWQ